MGPWCSRLNIPLLQSGDEKYNAGSNPADPTINHWLIFTFFKSELYLI